MFMFCSLVQRDALISMWMEQSGDPHNEQHQQITRFLQVSIDPQV